MGLNKIQIRSIYKEKRKSISLEEVNNISERISEEAIRFIQLNNFKNIHLFLPIKSQNEFDTQKIISFCFENHINVIVPISDLKNNTMDNALINENTVFENNPWDIPEPKSNYKLVQNEQIELVLTPLLAFDLSGYRVGYGKGFYDRFFSKCPKTTVKCGISFFEALEGALSTDQYDIPLDICISPSKIYYFK